MNVQERIERDLKTAMLSGDKIKAEILRGLKNSIQYEAVRLKLDKSKLSDGQIIPLLAKEAKKRQEAADLYQQANETERAKTEISEKLLIEEYLPEQLSLEEVEKVVDEEISKLDQPGMQQMGQIISQVRAKLGAQAEGGLIANLVKQKLEQK